MSKFNYLAFLLIILFSHIISAQSKDVYFSTIETDNLKLWYGLDNTTGINQKGNSGLELKQYNNGTAIYCANLYWGGFINSKFETGGTIYWRNSLQPGEYIYHDNPIAMAAQNHSFKYSPNWRNITDPQKKEEYENGFYNWRVDIGAPFYDSDKNGLYEPRTSNDAPGDIEDEMHWFVVNDMNSDKSNEYFLSEPFGIELQKTLFTVNYAEFKDVVFENTVIINKGNNRIDSMYFCIFSDNDLGDGGDDFVGVDTTLNLGFSYNSKNNDAVFGDAPPAVGHLILESPLKYNGNRNISSFLPNYKNNPNWTHDMAPYTEKGKGEIYNLLNGRMNNGRYFISQIDDKPTIFPFTGDPESKSGWFENADYFSASDRRYHINMGPITFNPGDKVNILDAILVARGNSNLNSVTKLKELAAKVILLYKTGELVTDIDRENEKEIPTEFLLKQNYPNPFNPTTTINYSIPKGGNVRLEIYNSLGEIVNIIQDSYQDAGNHSIAWTGKDSNGNSLSSGIYFYRLISNDFVQVKKMILLK
ncbi:hypothetical protein APF79_01625 [bacterium BRH_c32]|nr:MAG: hypothetical protein APF79_01625 [bacterium BRH_c32]